MQLCMRKVDTKAVMTVRMKFATLLIVSRFILITLNYTCWNVKRKNRVVSAGCVHDSVMELLWC